MASISRKSRSAAPGIVAERQFEPPSVVFRNVPLDPLAHTTFAFTALTPRKDAVVPLCWGSHDWAAHSAGSSHVAHALACSSGIRAAVGLQNRRHCTLKRAPHRCDNSYNQACNLYQ